MTQIKLDGKPGAAALLALEPHAQMLYARPGVRILGVVELAHVERTQPAPDEDKEPSVKLRVAGLEIANAEQEDALRRAQTALYRHRTAYGTITEDSEVELSDRVLEQTGGLLDAIEAARLRVAVRHWADQCRRALGVASITVTEMRHELDAVAAGLEAVLRGEADDGR